MNNSPKKNHSIDDLKFLSIRKIISKWGRNNYKKFPWRETNNKWHALLAEILLQRTRANNVVPVYEKFITIFPEPSDLKYAPLSKIKETIYHLGLPNRVETLKSLAIDIVKREGEIPSKLKELITLPGVGAYIAAAFLSFHCGKRSVIVDANVVRWICRLIDRQCDGETRRKQWLIELANHLTPQHKVKEYNYAVLDFTMKICIKKPLCEICPLGEKFCEYGKKNLQQKIFSN